MVMGVSPAVCLCIMCAPVPSEARRKHQVPQHWRYQWLLLAVMGIEPGSSGRPASTLNCWVISPLQPSWSSSLQTQSEKLCVEGLEETLQGPGDKGHSCSSGSIVGEGDSEYENKLGGPQYPFREWL